MEIAKPNAAEAPVAPGVAEATGGSGSAGDSLLIHPYLWPALPLKAPALAKQKKLSQLLNKGDKEGAAFLQSLEAAAQRLGAGEPAAPAAARRPDTVPSPACFRTCLQSNPPTVLLQRWSRPPLATRL